MSPQPNEDHLVAFDPGGTIGWSHFVVDCHAFSRPENKVMRYLKEWDCGEFSGPEHEQVTQCVALITSAHFGEMPFNSTTDIIAEDFELTQLIGGKNLLSPVRINAVLDWECRKQGLELQLQARQLRTSITKQRLQLFGFTGTFRQDEFSAMQHGVTWLRRIKQKSIDQPWKLSDEISHNAYWDCACSEGGSDWPCDLNHPR